MSELRMKPEWAGLAVPCVLNVTSQRCPRAKTSVFEVSLAAARHVLGTVQKHTDELEGKAWFSGEWTAIRRSLEQQAEHWLAKNLVWC